MLKNNQELKQIVSSDTYYKEFWNSVRNRNYTQNIPQKAKLSLTGTQILPLKTSELLRDKIKDKSLFRKLATVNVVDKNSGICLVNYSDGNIEWLKNDVYDLNPENLDEGSKHRIKSNSLATLVTISEDLTTDNSYDIENGLTDALSKKFAKAENQAFLTGDGQNMPFGILDQNTGCEIGAETNQIKAEDIKKLCFELDKDYRENASWIMNDKTALYLSELKDENGNQLFNFETNTMLGKPVYLTNEMPDYDSGNMPILFGDFSYYWIFERHIPTVKVLKEMFTLESKMGYLAYEFLDARLIKRDAIKALKTN